MAGFTDPEGRRTGFGVLLIGCHSSGDLIYLGKIGGGHDEETLEPLGSKHDLMDVNQTLFVVGDPPEGTHWIEPLDRRRERLHRMDL